MGKHKSMSKGCIALEVNKLSCLVGKHISKMLGLMFKELYMLG